MPASRSSWPMTRLEFAAVMAYLETAVGKPFGADRAEVYWDLLGDLPKDALGTAAKVVALEHPWSTFPSVAELRAAAAKVMQGSFNEMTPGEAWQLAWKAAANIDLDLTSEYRSGGEVYPNQASCAMKDLPPIVVEAMKAFGLPALCYGKEPVGVVRSQWIKIYKGLQARDRRLALLPPKLTQAIEGRGKALPA